MAERKYAGPKLPATLGNVALKVSEYATKDGVTTVKGNHLQTGDELSVQLMSPVRAANMMKGRNDVDDRERVRIWEERFANRRDLTVFSDQSNEHSVKPGGVLLLNNTRLDFSDRRYYAQAAYGFVSDPEAQAAISGMISLSKFNDGSIRLQVFQPENASLLSASDKDDAQRSVKAAFEARSPVGSGVMARAVIVTLKEAGSEGQSKAFYMRSASFEADSGNGVQFQLSNGFGDTLKRTNLDSNSGAGAAAIAAATGVSVQMVLDRLGADSTEEDRDSLKKIYDAVASGATSAALTPGYTIPIVLKSVEHLSKRPELFHSGAFSGAVAIAVRGAGGGALERPAAYAVTSYSTLPKSEPENAPTPAKEAIKAHDRLVSSTGGSAEAAPATRPPTRFASPGRDF